jgi:hypothetical protein
VSGGSWWGYIVEGGLYRVVLVPGLGVLLVVVLCCVLVGFFGWGVFLGVFAFRKTESGKWRGFLRVAFSRGKVFIPCGVKRNWGVFKDCAGGA